MRCTRAAVAWHPQSTASIHFAVKLAAGETWILCRGMQSTIKVSSFLYSVQYNGGLLRDIILLTRCGFIGEPVLYHEEVLSLQPMFPPKPLDIFSPEEGGCSEGLDAFRFFLNTYRK